MRIFSLTWQFNSLKYNRVFSEALSERRNGPAASTLAAPDD
jgi:hypothetical protein